LLVVGAHGAHTRRRSRLGTTVQKLLRLEPCPMLTVRHATHGRYRRILAPVDFSPASRAALRAVSDAFPHTELHVGHAFEHPMESMMRYAAVDESVIKGYTARRRAMLARELRRWTHATAPARPSFDFHVGHGYPTAVIERLMRKLHVDLVALAPRGKSALEKSFLGSVALHVALNASCDVLLLAGARVGGDRAAAATEGPAGETAAPVTP
jgi:CPA2 family monovalent cation:H+ antiporter-2